MNYTLITGATGGLGKAYVFELAKRGESLLLTGRSEEKLAALKEEVLNLYPDLSVLTYACRLDREKERADFYAFFDRICLSCAVLVAGADIQKPFQDYTEEKLLFQQRVNFEANVSLAKFCFEHKAEGFSLLAVSSVSGLYPMPYFALYSATKGALTSFFSAIHYEWRGKAKVTVVIPGAIPTRDDVKDNIKTQGIWGKLAVKSPEFVAKNSLKALKKNKMQYVPGFWNNVMRVGTAIIPLTWKMRFIERRWSKTTKDAFPL
ncbi:MAG: SDR family NAD(P)-dependent oxidoreductase [Clostridia bacterium]|nr:SDR family NAD(P)-dependent oxidoreductase [Clostridia bacterium]